MCCQMNTSLPRDTTTETTNCMVKIENDFYVILFMLVLLCSVVVFCFFFVSMLMAVNTCIDAFGQGIVNQLLCAWEFVMLSNITPSQQPVYHSDGKFGGELRPPN